MHIVIVGGGFGGVKTALELGKDTRFKVTLISDKDHFLYYPALYGTATGGSHLESSVPLKTIFKDFPRVKVIRDQVTGIDHTRKLIVGKEGQYQYDTAVFALGVVTTYFGIEGLAENSYGIKSIEEVDRLKAHLHDTLATDKHLDKNYIVVGAGATGVELSAALATYITCIARNHGLRRAKASIKLIEAAPRVLPRMSKRTSKNAIKRLRKLGVVVKTGSTVKAADSDSIMVNDQDISSHTIIWTSGVTNHPFFKKHTDVFELNDHGRVKVDHFMQAAPHIYVIGDNADTPYSGLAQTALHDAGFLADHLKRLVGGRVLNNYHARKPPVVVPVGENWAVFEWGPLILSGFIASLLRRAADFIGYDDILPIGQALGVWHAQFVREESCEVCSEDTGAILTDKTKA